jgi:hypothetical protein
MTDLNIRNVTVQINDTKEDRTDFLKYGHSYNTLQTQKDINCSVHGFVFGSVITIQSDKDGYYFVSTGINISLYDKIVLQNSDTLVFCYINSIQKTKYYFDYYSEVNILSKSFTTMIVIKYIDIHEFTNVYEMTIDNQPYEKIPIFLPYMNQKMSSNKKILIHVKNTLNNCEFIIVPRNNNYMNDLTSTKVLSINHTPDKNKKGYETYIVDMLYNGNKSWFTI